MFHPRSDTPCGLANAIEFIKLEEAIREFTQGQRIIFIVNAGNWGDGLIRYATERFFLQRGFDFTAIPFKDALETTRDQLELLCDSKEVRAVYSGGGVFFQKYRMHRTMPGLLAKTDAMLVLPHSFSVPIKKLGFRPQDVLFRRDRDHSISVAPRSLFCHDMALSLPLIAAPHPKEKIGYFFRTDRERASNQPLPNGNRDISQEGTEQKPVSEFFTAISEYSEVHTDRLHVSIAAALMGRSVHLYANSYFKNLSIYESSLAAAFPNVTFHADFNRSTG